MGKDLNTYPLWVILAPRSPYLPFWIKCRLFTSCKETIGLPQIPQTTMKKSNELTKHEWRISNPPIYTNFYPQLINATICKGASSYSLVQTPIYAFYLGYCLANMFSDNMFSENQINMFYFSMNENTHVEVKRCSSAAT